LSARIATLLLAIHSKLNHDPPKEKSGYSPRGIIRDLIATTMSAIVDVKDNGAQRLSGNAYPAEGMHAFINLLTHDDVNKESRIVVHTWLNAAKSDGAFDLPWRPGAVDACPKIG
jgi:hypothetical protein